MNPSPLALLRYQAISAYLAFAPPRGKRGPLLAELAARIWTLPDGRPVQFSAETLRSWVRRYRQGGLEALEDQPRPRLGVTVVAPETAEHLCQLKQEVPERSLDRILRIAEDLGIVAPGSVSRSTLHRVLKARGLSERPRPDATTTDLDRFEADSPNALWQSDMLAGPWLPDPERPGKVRRAWLYAFLDDHSRLLLAGRFSFKGDLPALELVFRQALRRHGVPTRVYYDNGATYRSHHMRQVVAALGIHGLVFTTKYRPQGHGKIEAFNRLCKSGFIAEVKSSTITTLDGLNAAFAAWIERYYNREVHGETLQSPRERWRAGLDRVRHVDEEILRRAFLFTETRKPDKAGVLSLLGCRYQVGPDLARKRKRVELRFDPERFEEIEVWFEGRFVERVRPFEVQPHRRPKAAAATDTPTPSPAAPTADWLGHLVAERKARLDDDPEVELRRELDRRQALDDAVVAVMRDRLDPDAMDEGAVRRWLERYGPLEAEPVADLLDLALPTHGPGQHVHHYLEMLRADLAEGGDA